MSKMLPATAWIVVSALVACPAIAQQSAAMSFFITSVGPGDGANLGGLEGADRHCQALAVAVGAGSRTWRAYLSVMPTDGAPAINARDRIGSGPWVNVKGVQVALSVDDLHSEKNTLNKETALTEKGEPVQRRMHDILTGSEADGTGFSGTLDTTCHNWTSNFIGSAQLGHHDRAGGGTSPTSWNSAHPSQGCSPNGLQGTGGNGLFYCFAAD